jgi:hypothetical protein
LFKTVKDGDVPVAAQGEAKKQYEVAAQEVFLCRHRGGFCGAGVVKVKKHNDGIPLWSRVLMFEFFQGGGAKTSPAAAFAQSE